MVRQWRLVGSGRRGISPNEMLCWPHWVYTPFAVRVSAHLAAGQRKRVLRGAPLSRYRAAPLSPKASVADNKRLAWGEKRGLGEREGTLAMQGLLSLSPAVEESHRSPFADNRGAGSAGAGWGGAAGRRAPGGLRTMGWGRFVALLASRR